MLTKMELSSMVMRVIRTMNGNWSEVNSDLYTIDKKIELIKMNICLEEYLLSIKVGIIPKMYKKTKKTDISEFSLQRINNDFLYPVESIAMEPVFQPILDGIVKMINSHHNILSTTLVHPFDGKPLDQVINNVFVLNFSQIHKAVDSMGNMLFPIGYDSAYEREQLRRTNTTYPAITSLVLVPIYFDKENDLVQINYKHVGDPVPYYMKTVLTLDQFKDLNLNSAATIVSRGRMSKNEYNQLSNAYKNELSFQDFLAIKYFITILKNNADTFCDIKNVTPREK